MKVKVDSFLTAAVLDGATSKTPVDGIIQSVKLIPKEELGFKSEEDKYELQVTVKGETYGWMANKTSLRAIVTKFGSESDLWKGKKISLYSMESNVAGEIRDVIYCTVS